MLPLEAAPEDQASGNWRFIHHLARIAHGFELDAGRNYQCFASMLL